MGIKRVVDVDFWNDDKVMEMFSPEDKLFFLYLLTNPHTTQLGIYPINIKHISFEIGYSNEAVSVLLERFENKYKMIRYSQSTKEIAIKNFLKHSIIKGGAPVRDCIVKELKNVKDKELISFVFSYIKHYENLNTTVSSIIAEYETQNGEVEYCHKRKSNQKENNINEIQNDNDNDISWYDTSNDTTTYRTALSKPIRHKYGEYKNILLTDEDLEKWKAEAPNSWSEYIETMSNYIARRGKGYQNYLAALRDWKKRDEKKGGNENGQNEKYTKNIAEISAIDKLFTI